MVGAGSSLLNPAVKLRYANWSYEHQRFFLRAYWNGFFADTAAPSHPLLDGFVTVTDPTGSPDLRFRGNTYKIEGQPSTQISEAGRLTYGINYRYNSFSCNCVSTNGHEHRLGMYLQGEWAILPSINVIGGLRYDLHTQINPTYSPRLAVVYTPI